jgi:glycosyltransferase involved in cell wall biosynthesis
MFKSLSVIVPAYNCETTLQATLVSIQASLRFFGSTSLGREVTATVMIVDDCSSDGTASLAASMSSQAPEFRLIRTAENRGAGYARNLGVKTAPGELLFFCDGDDLYFENHIYTCFKILAESPSADAVKTGVYTEEKLHPHFDKVVQTSIPLNLCVKRACHDFVEGFPEEPMYRQREDTAYVLMLARFFKILFTDVKTVQYLRFPGNAFDRQLKKFQNPPGTVPDVFSEEEQVRSVGVWKLFDEKYQRLLRKKGENAPTS